MPDTPLKDRFARYGVALDEARRRGVVRERQSPLRRLTPVLALGAAIATLIAAMVLIPRTGAEQPLTPAQRVEAEKEIREAFEVWLDPQSPEEGRRSVRERGRDDAEELRRETQWTLVGERVVALRLRVTEVELVDRTTAFVDLRGGGSEMFAATATKQDDAWRVAYATACAVGNAVGRTCDPDEFLTDEQQRIGQPFVDIPFGDRSDDERVRDIEDGEAVREQILEGFASRQGMLGTKAQLLAVRHRAGDRRAQVWWTVGTVQPGVAVLDGTRWTVSRETWCALSKNAGFIPPACDGSTPEPFERPLDIRLGTSMLWPAEGRLDESSADLTEAARRFLAALGLRPTSIVAPPGHATGPTWIGTTVEDAHVPLLLVPTEGVWAVHSLAKGFAGHRFGWESDPFEGTDDLTIAWRDDEVTTSARASQREFPYPPEDGSVRSAISITRGRNGRVNRIVGGVAMAAPRPTSARSCSTEELVVSGGESTRNPFGDGDAFFVAIENRAGVACALPEVVGIEMQQAGGTWVKAAITTMDSVDTEDRSSLRIPGDEFFTPDLVAEVLLAGVEGQGVAEYRAIRISLPGGGALQFARGVKTVGRQLIVRPLLFARTS
jgi:hypothetical protein